jgi:hypothetical protein
MDAKNLIFYPVMVASICWCLLSLFKMKNFIDFLKIEYPQCTMTNENRNVIFFTTMIVLSLVQHPLETFGKSFFKNIIPEKKFPLGSLERDAKAQMLGERVFKITMNIFCVTSLYHIMLREDCDFLDTRIGGRSERPLYFFNHPCQKLPSMMDSFYVFKLSYHLYELGYTIMFDRKRHDFPEYVLHHFLTFTLIYFSYVVNYLPVGAAVMILHDVTDLGASIFKLVVDITPMTYQIGGYIVMVVSWVYFRLWYFPVFVIYRIYEESQEWHGKTWNANLICMLTGFLCVLFFLHCFWFYLMFKGLMKRFGSKSGFNGHVSLGSNENKQ